MADSKTNESKTWHKALEPDELAEGRVKTVTLGVQSICMTHWQGQYGALDNHCPHQGGPLGEGSIENGHLRCPWHGWDYCPLSGKPPDDGFDDGVPTFEVNVRKDGVYVAVPEPEAQTQNVSDVMIESMVNWGVRFCFGMVGHSNLHVAEALRKQEEKGALRYIGIRHEGAASFACSAYGKLTGRPAACLAIAGPGATNLLTGLWDAHVDRAPVIALTGQVATQVLGTGNFQEVDLKEAFGGVAAFSQPVLPGSRHGELMARAAKTAILGRGVAHLIFPDEVAGVPAPAQKPSSPRGRMPANQIAPAPGALDEALTALRAAKRPVFIVGHGARFDRDAIIALAETLNAPVVTTFKGKGLIADNHPLAGGVLGRSGTPIASWFMNESDLLVVLGASFSNHTGITPKKPILQIDDDAQALGKFHPVDYPIHGSLGPSLAQISSSLGATQAVDQRQEVAARWQIWRDEKHSRLQDDRGKGCNAASVFESLTRLIDSDAIIAVDVGNNTYSFGRYFECRNQAVLMSGYLGSIGFGFPAALGAWAATQEENTPFSGRQVVSISGDGGFGQYMGEFNTAVKENMNITHILLNNGQLGKITKEQRAGQWPVWQTSLSNPSFAAYAELCGGKGLQVTRNSDIESALRTALEHPGPALVEILTDPELV